MYIAIDSEFHILAAGNTDKECVERMMEVYRRDYDEWHKKANVITLPDKYHIPYAPKKSLKRDRYYKSFDFKWDHIHHMTSGGWSIETRQVKITSCDGEYTPHVYEELELEGSSQGD